jgi:2-keto-3-deoxy-L-rhamnonate aldolase RhmA
LPAFYSVSAGELALEAGRPADVRVEWRRESIDKLIAMQLAKSTAAATTIIVAAMYGVGQTKHQNAVIDLWMQGKAAFGVFVPDENPGTRGQGPRPAMYTKEGGEKLAMSPLYDFVFLNLEGSYDAASVRAIAEGLRSARAVSRKTLLVRIPPIRSDGEAAARTRVREALDAGADGVTIPHIEGLDQGKLASSFFANANVWSPSNPDGEKLAMLMLEDPGAVAQAREIADLKGISILACGIGSLTRALGGDRAGAEAGTQEVLAETRRVGLVNMLTVSPQDVEKRVKEGFLALLAQGPSADETIRIGRAASGR